MLREAWKRRALEVHPDKGGNPDEFKSMKNAFDVLSDPQKRLIYDQHGPEAVKQMESAMMNGQANSQFQ